MHENDTNLSRTLACSHQIDFLFLSHLLLLSLFIKSIKETMPSSRFCDSRGAAERFSEPLSRYRATYDPRSKRADKELFVLISCFTALQWVFS